MTISKADIQAALDVVRQLTDEIDDLTVEDAIALHDEVEALQKAAKLCAELLETRSVNLLDGQPAKVGDKVYVPSSSGTGKWRPDQKSIRAVVYDRAMADAVNHETGEVEAAAAVRSTLDLMFLGFVPPSKMPTQGFLEKLGISNKHVAVYERGREKLKVIDQEKAIDDE